MFEPGIDEKLLETVLTLSPSRELAERALAETGSVSVEAAASWLKSNGEADNMLKPNTEKTVNEGGVGRLQYACVGIQGWRSYMEDISTIEPEVKNRATLSSCLPPPSSKKYTCLYFFFFLL